MEVVELGAVPGFVVFDLSGAPLSAGGTRLAADVSVAEVALLARAMTYKFAALGQQVGGAKAGVRGDPADRAGKAALMTRFCAEVRPLVEAGRFVTGPDMGTSEEDLAPLRAGRAAPTAMNSVVDGVPFEDVVTGYGVTVAAGTALDGGPGSAGQGWDGRSVAIEGFGKVGGGVAREVIRRGGRVVAASTVAGCVADPAGLDVGRLLGLRREYGDDRRPDRRGAAPDVRVVAPAANAPYTAEGAAVLRQRGVVALPDFVCNAGAVIGYRSAADASPGQVLAAVEATISGLIRQALDHEDGPLAGACERAGAFLRGWWGEPPAPPLALAQ